MSRKSGKLILQYLCTGGLVDSWRLRLRFLVPFSWLTFWKWRLGHPGAVELADSLESEG